MVGQFEGESSDPLGWLEDGASTRTREWLGEQKSLLHNVLQTHPCRREVEVLVQRVLNTTSMDLPMVTGQRYVYLLRGASDAAAILYAKDGENGAPRVLYSPDCRDGRTENISLLGLSPDGERVLIAVRPDGRDDVGYKIISAATGELLWGEFPAFRSARTTFKRCLTGYYHLRVEGTHVVMVETSVLPEQRETVVLVLPRGELNDYYIQVLDTNCNLVIYTSRSGQDTRDYYLVDIERTTYQLRPIWLSFRHLVFLQADSTHIYALTDWGAPNRRVLRAKIGNGDLQWDIIVPESDQPIVSLVLASTKVIVIYTTPFGKAPREYSKEGDPLETAFQPLAPLPGTIAAKSTAGGRLVFYEHSSFGYRPMIYREDLATTRSILWFQPRGRHDNIRATLETKWIESRDGTRIPITISHRGGVQPSADTPCILTGYGGFGIAEGPHFTNRSELWMSLGGLYASAGIRGGGEFGAEWHRAGRRESKQRGFEDFIAVAEWLIGEGYTSPERLAIVGGSNGGLLVGAVMVQRPELFAAVICFGPLLDMLRYHLFPGGSAFLEEYGSPNDPEMMPRLAAYSPYHGVRDGVKYPAVLIISGDADTRCDPMHARKMTARLQLATSSDRPVLLDYHEKRGHAALLPLRGRIATLTNQFCFLLSALNLDLSNGEMVPKLRVSGLPTQSSASVVSMDAIL